MVQIKPRFLSFEDYLSYNDGTENLYELFNGELIEVPPESGFNVEIANFLFSLFLPIVGHRRIRGHGLELEVRGEPKNRYPDLTIIREEHIQLLRKRNTIRLNMAPPSLVIEIVSPGALQHERDYIAKRLQYQDLGIPEYWLVDPQAGNVLMLELSGATYTEVHTFKDNDLLRSPQLGALTVTVAQLLAATH